MEADAYQTGLRGRARALKMAAEMTGGLYVCRAVYGLLPTEVDTEDEAMWRWSGDGKHRCLRIRSMIP